MGAKDSKTTAHMAVAIWVMIGAIMSVLGGVAAHLVFISGGTRSCRSSRISN